MWQGGMGHGGAGRMCFDILNIEMKELRRNKRVEGRESRECQLREK